MGMIWTCYLSHTNCASHILRKVNAESKVCMVFGSWLDMYLSMYVMTLLQVYTKVCKQSYLCNN